jgi:hypothetical protein
MKRLLSTIFAIGLIPAAFGFDISDNFDSGRPSNFWGSTQKATLSSANGVSGSKSFAFVYDGGPDGTDAWAEMRFNLPAPTQEIFMQYDLYIPSNYYHRTQSNLGYGSDNNKSLVQLWSGDYGAVASNVFVGIEQWPTGDGSSFPALRYGTNHVDKGNWQADGMTVGQKIIRVPDDLGKWRRFKVHVRLADKGMSNGIVEIWRDGQLIVKSLPLSNYSAAGNYFDQGYILGWSNSGFAQTTTMYVDNFRISNTDFDESTTTIDPPNSPNSLSVSPK